MQLQVNQLTVLILNLVYFCSGRDGITENYIYSATVVRLREASIGYTVPFTKGAVKSLRLSFNRKKSFILL
ncbi:hypothetical protein CS542_09040 [Pedobacter sp. IW39]|nr:hypothetical protein CS542_09040 [Pedobacter sp. IW39]